MVLSLFHKPFPCHSSALKISASRWLFILCFCSLNFSISAQEIVPTLAADQLIERPLNGGETHIFQVSLLAGQYICVVVEQYGIDVEVKLVNGNKQKLVEMDTLNSTQGPEVIATIAERNETYQIEVSSPSKSFPAGVYQIKIVALRLATERDHLWLTAQRFYLEGKQLSEQPTPESQEQAIRKFAEALRIWQVLEDRLMVAHTLYYLAAGYRRIGQTQHALVYYSYALELVRSIKQDREVVTALTSLAIVLSELGESRKALEYYEQALLQWRAFKDAFGEAQTLINLGLVRTQLGEIRVALDHYDKALAVWQKLGNRFQAAETLTRIGLAYDNLGEWQRSLEYTTQARVLYRAVDNKRGEAVALNNLGLVYGKSGESRKALDYYSQSLAIWQMLGNRREMANSLGNIGQAEAQQNNQPKALEAYQQSLKLWREAGDRRGEALVLQRLGDLQTDAPQTALEFYQQALPLLRTAGDSLRTAYVLLSIGNLHLTQGAPQQALEVLPQALTILQTSGDRFYEAQTLYSLARAQRALGNLTAARQHIEAALTKAEALRTEAGSQQLRASYLAKVHKFYELNVDLLMQLQQAQPSAGFEALALQASERARARSLVELLTEAHANIRVGVDETLLAREQALTQQLNAKAQRQLQLTAQRGNAAQLQTIKQEISALEDEYNQVETKIRQSNPHYAALTQPQPLSLPEIQQQLDADSLLLEYALGEERSWLWAVTKTSITSFPLPRRAQIESAALQVRDLLIVRSQRPRGETARQREARIAQADAQFPAAAAALSQILLGPVASQLESRRLIIVADGALQYVPFGALPSPNEEGGRRKAEVKRPNAKEDDSAMQRSSFIVHPLIVDHEIITLPSASTIAVLRKELAGRPVAPKMLAVFADPVFTSEEARRRSNKARTGATLAAATPSRSIIHEDEKAAAGSSSLSIPQLPFTRQEAEQILALAPNAENFKALDFAATRTAALNPALSQYRYLHFATHGFSDSERPGLSALVLSLADETGKPQDGFLRAHELYNLKLPAELVVLSACQTGLGKEVKGEGLIGLTRGFMYAGAPRVVVSLWNVNDKATAELMTIFYRQMLKENQRPAAALRAAQIQMWKHKQWQAPYYWAAFELQGEWR